jgi:RNA polymerase sigma factor (sigma-70 family)
MPTDTLTPFLRHLRHAAEPAAGPTDRHLLERFLARRDQAAFTALVRRHGPRVLAACRRVLTDSADADDAFQATFLVLVRRAGSVRWQSSVGNWLTAVAHRLAVRARADASRRRDRERRAADRTTAAGPPDLSWREACDLLHRELDRLPDRFRRPLLLCYLEGRSRDEAAAELGWSPGALKGSLERGRKLLRNRLARRGVTLAVGLSLLGRPAARAAVPERLLDSVVQMATPSPGPAGAAVPAAVARLAHGAPATMRLTPRTVLAAGLLAAGLLTLGAGLQGRNAAADPPAAMPAKPTAPTAGPRGEPAAPGAPVTVTGRVVDPDGKPVDGATVHLWTAAAKKPADAPALTTTGADGRFRLTLAAAERKNVYLIARGTGYAPDWGKVPAGGEVTLRLVRDDVPIEGRILDLEGRPVPGATLKVTRVSQKAGGDLAAWLEENVEQHKRGFYHTDDGLSVIRPEAFDGPVTVSVGADGRFRLTGYGRERIVAMELRGPGIETVHFRAATRPGPTAGYIPGRWGLYAATFDWLVGPAKPIVGTVRDKRTGRPIAGITVMDAGNYARFVTGEDGRYRLDGVGKRGEYLISAGGGKGRPYFDVTANQVKDTAGLDPLTLDFDMERGVEVTGRLTNRATGKPVPGRVHVFTPPDNPNLTDFTTLGGPKFIVSDWGRAGPDGVFTLLTVPGRSVLVAAADDENGFALFDARKELPKRKIYSFPTGATHALVEINPDPADPKSLTCDIALEPGRALTGSLTGPDGKPVSGAYALGLGATELHLGPPRMTGPVEPPLKDAGFTVRGLTPGRGRVLIFFQPEARLAKVQRLRGDEAGPLTVKLEPLGAAHGRVLDAQGRPTEGLTVTARFALREESADDLPWSELVQNGLYGSLIREVKTDREGRYRVEGLLPGVPYEILVSQGKPSDGAAVVPSRQLAPEPGKDADLGDVTGKP